MINIRLAGGLGNQIFQIAAGLLFAQQVDSNLVYLNESALGKYSVKRKNDLFNLFDFNSDNYLVEISASIVDDFRLARILSFRTRLLPFVSDNNFTFKLGNLVANGSNVKNYYLDGYFQSCLSQKNFDEQVAILKNLKKNEFKNVAVHEGCLIHVRGGDFVKLGWSDVAPEDYYVKAIKYFSEHFKVENFYIVTDDVDYASTLLSGAGVSFSFLPGDLLEHFSMIGSFKYRILSSSTFSLWASALSDVDDSIVIAPKFWSPDVHRRIKLPGEIFI